MKHQGTQTLHTRRLMLRRFVPEDAAAMYRNWASDPEVTRYLTWPTHPSEAVSAAVLADWCPRYAAADYYHWAVVHEATGEPVGSIAVVKQDDDIAMAHVGYVLGRRWWRQGLASEALQAVLDYLLDTVGMQRIEARHDPRNPRSGAVMRRCGMTCEGTLRRADRNNQGVCDAVMYAILADDRRPTDAAQRFRRLMDRCYEAQGYGECFGGFLSLAEEGYPPAEALVGSLIREGLGCRGDAAQALYWTQRAADHGDRDGACNLAWYLEEGYGLPADPAAARTWYLRAARLGSEPAIEKCRELGVSPD